MNVNFHGKKCCDCYIFVIIVTPQRTAPWLHLKVSVYSFSSTSIQFTSSPILVHVHVLHTHVHTALATCTAQHVGMPTISQFFNFLEENSCGQNSPRNLQKHCASKFGTVRYMPKKLRVELAVGI